MPTIRLFNHYVSIRLALLTLLEGLVLFQSVLVGYQLKLPNPDLPMPAFEAAVFATVMLVTMAGVGLYQSLAEPFRRMLHRLIVAYGLALIAMSVIFYVFDGVHVGRDVFALSSLFAVASLVSIRVLFFRLTDFGLPRRRVLIVGNGVEAEKLIRYLHAGRQGRSVQYAGLYPVVAERDVEEAASPSRHDRLLRTVRDLRVSEIVIAVRERRGGVLPLRQLLECKLRGIRVMDLVSFHEREHGLLPIDNLHASWLIFGTGFEQGWWRDVIKRTFDFALALVVLALTAPVLVVASLLVQLESPGALFVREVRVGQGGRLFERLCLRTGSRRAGQAHAQTQCSPAFDGTYRRGPVGRLVRAMRIDEFASLLNVLRGELSFVGPRAQPPAMVARLGERVPYYEVRHSVKPGLTGWSQLRHLQRDATTAPVPIPAATSALDTAAGDAIGELQYDLYYVKNHSLFLDLMILVETAQILMLGRPVRPR